MWGGFTIAFLVCAEKGKFWENLLDVLTYCTIEEYFVFYIYSELCKEY